MPKKDPDYLSKELQYKYPGIELRFAKYLFIQIIAQNGESVCLSNKAVQVMGK